METSPDSDAAAGRSKEHLKAAADDFKTAAKAKADELKAAAESRAREFRGAAETAWSDAQSRAKFWQSEGEAYVRENPTKAILMALGAGFLLGLCLRK